MKFAFVAKRRSIWPVAGSAKRWGLSFWLHAWLNRSPSRHARQDEVLLDKIKDSFQDGDRTYGARRVWPTFSPKASSRPASHRTLDARNALEGEAEATRAAERWR